MTPTRPTGSTARCPRRWPRTAGWKNRSGQNPASPSLLHEVSRWTSKNRLASPNPNRPKRARGTRQDPPRDPNPDRPEAVEGAEPTEPPEPAKPAGKPKKKRGPLGACLMG